MKTRTVLTSLALGLGLTLTMAPACPAQEGRDREMRKILNGLEAGIGALRALGRKEDAAHLLEIFREVQAKGRQRAERRHRHSDEREFAQWQLQVLRHAKAAFAEGKKGDALELTERWMHALELGLEGRRDREARQIIERAPGLGNKVELLTYASKLLHEYKATEKAQAVRKLADQLRRNLRGKKREREGRRERDRPRRERTERKVVQHWVKVLSLASELLADAKRRDGAETLMHAAEALELALHNKRDDRSMRIRRTAPKAGVQAEWLGYAAKVAAERGKRDRAGMFKELSHELAQRARRERGREGGEREREGRRRGREREERERLRERKRREREEEEEEEEDDDDEWRGELKRYLGQMKEQIADLQQQIKRMRRDLDRLRRRDI